MKKFFSIISFGVLIFAATAARANVTFDASHAFQIFGDDRWEGSNRHFGFLFDIGNDLKAGYFFEEANWDWRADIGQAVPNFVNTSAHINGLRMIKKFSKFISAGIDIGTAQISIRAGGGTTATAAAAAPLAQTKPFVDVLGRAHYAVKSARGITSGVHLDIGYRFLDINDVPAGGVLGAAAERTLDDLNALMLGLGVFMSF